MEDIANKLYLAFIENIGINLNDKYVYHFYFSDVPEVVWGEFWNVCPCSIVPFITPDKATITNIYECELEYEINLVTSNSCFSMQDCIDQIIALGWLDLHENILYDGKSMSFKFGEHFEDTENKIKQIDGSFSKIWEKTDDTESMIDNLIDKIGGGNDEW